MKKLQVVVVKLSNSFEKLWPKIGSELDVTTTICEANEPETITRDVAAVVVSAGGAEQDVFNWLDRHDTPYGVPVFVVGGDLGRRTAPDGYFPTPMQPFSSLVKPGLERNSWHGLFTLAGRGADRRSSR